MSKSNLEMLLEIQNLVEKPLYDDLSPYYRGVRDIINFLNDREYATSEDVYNFMVADFNSLYDDKGAIK